MNWRIAGASVQGVGHRKAGKPCEDAHCWRAVDGALLIAVADGSGSASLAEAGASFAAGSAVRLLGERLAAGSPGDDDGWKSALAGALHDTRAALQAEASARGVPAGDLASTLILVAARPGIVAAAQIGDGAVALEDDQANLMLLTAPRPEEYINETSFVISPDAVETAQVSIWRGSARHLAIFSDGLQSLALKLPEFAPHVPFFRPLFDHMARLSDDAQVSADLVAFLLSPRIAARTDDDLTLLLATAPDDRG